MKKTPTFLNSYHQKRNVLAVAEVNAQPPMSFEQSIKQRVMLAQNSQRHAPNAPSLTAASSHKKKPH